MRAKYEVKIHIDVTAFLEADSGDEAVSALSSEVENRIKGYGSSALVNSMEIDSVDLQESEATAL